MVTFIIVRHGYSLYNKEKRFTGQSDIDLDEIGFAQARRNAEYVLANYRVDRIYSSDLCRAYNTAKPVADALGLPITTSEKLRELYIGEWEGRKVADIKEEQPEAFQYYRTYIPESCPPGGETKQQLRTRVTEVMAEIAAENEGKTVLVASHGGTIRSLCCAWMGLPIEEITQVPNVGNASLTVVDYHSETGKATFRLYGQTEHLGELAIEKKKKKA